MPGGVSPELLRPDCPTNSSAWTALPKAMRETIFEIRQLTHWLRQESDRPVGVIGISIKILDAQRVIERMREAGTESVVVSTNGGLGRVGRRRPEA